MDEPERLRLAERVGAWSVLWFLVELVVAIVIGLAVVATVLSFIGLAFAHDSWISKNRLTDPASGEWCCNATDCRAEKVAEVAGGFRTEAGDTVPFSRVIWKSQDGAWWRCRNMRTNATRCLIGPPPGS